MRFAKDNKIRYGQDFAWYEGIPADVDFEVIPLTKNGDKVKLVAPGYGGKPYGNGALYLSRYWSIPPKRERNNEKESRDR